MKERVQAVVAWGSRLGLEYTRTRASLAAGGLAYFVALSLAPAALAFGTLAGLFLDPADVREVLERLAERAPGTVGDLQPVIEALVSTVETASASAFTLTTIVSALIAIYASSKVVFGVRMAMNTVFGVEETRSGLVERGDRHGRSPSWAWSPASRWSSCSPSLPRASRLARHHRRPPHHGQLAGRLADRPRAHLPGRSLDPAPCAQPRSPRSRGPRGAPWSPRWASAAATVGVGIYARFSASLSAAVLVFGTAVVILLWLYLCFVALLWGAIIEADDARTRTSAGDQPPAP